MDKRLSIVALSISSYELENKLLYSLYYNYSIEQIRLLNVVVICQGYSFKEQDYFITNYPDVFFFFCDRLPKGTSISKIRRVMYEEVDVFNKIYQYIFLMDDDFVFGAHALDNLSNYMDIMDSYKSIGMIAMHRRYDNEGLIPYLADYNREMHGISMRSGLLLRNNVLKVNEMFVDKICYQEEYYLAFAFYLAGFDICKGWTNIWHRRSIGSGLGTSLSREFNTQYENRIMSTKRYLYDNGYIKLRQNIDDIILEKFNGIIYPEKIKMMHNSNAVSRGFIIGKVKEVDNFVTPKEYAKIRKTYNKGDLSSGIYENDDNYSRDTRVSSSY